MRSTLADIAREAGVSNATVDRVLNNRPGVKGRTREVVLETAQRLGYIEDHKPQPAASIERVRLLFVLPKGTNAYIANLQNQIVLQASHRLELDVAIQAIEGFNPDTLAKTLRELDGDIRGVGIIALDHPSVRAAIQSIEARGVKIVTLASDIHVVARTAYVGIDNRAAGRLAGYIMGRFMGPGGSRKVALFAGSLSYRGHEEREMGFRHVLAEDFPNLKIVELREMGDDRERAYREATMLLDQYEDLAGIYNIGAGNQGIARALREHGKAGKVTFIGHDATEGNKALLLDGTIDAVIDQNPRVQAREALNILYSAVTGSACQTHPFRLQIVFRENIPED